MLTEPRADRTGYRPIVITHVVEFIEDPRESLALLRVAATRLTVDLQATSARIRPDRHGSLKQI
jgi:hypothetical protein